MGNILISLADEIDYEQEVFQENPWNIYKNLRIDSPVCWSPKNNCYYISKYQTVKQILNDKENFTSEHPFRTTRHLFGPTLIDLDGDKHSNYRQIFSYFFKHNYVNLISEDVIKSTVTARFDEISSRTTINIVEDIGAIIPMQIILKVIGLPVRDAEFIFKTLQPIMRYLDYPKNGMTDALKSSEILRNYISNMLENSSEFPSDSIIGSILLSNESDVKITLDELVRHILLLLSAGTETTMGTISNFFVCLLNHPDILDLVQDNNEFIVPAIRETIRFEPPLHNTLRIAKSDIEIYGVKIPKKSAVQLLIASANRDEDYFERPDEWNIFRNEKNSLSFGAGPHNCLGYSLANKELEYIILEFFQRFKVKKTINKKVPIIKGKSFRYANNVLLDVEPRRG